MGRSPCLLPPLITANNNAAEEQGAEDILQRIHKDICEAKDNLIMARVLQAAQANRTRSSKPDLKSVILFYSTHTTYPESSHRRRMEGQRSRC